MQDKTNSFRSRVFEDCWNIDKASGTCFHPVHNAASVSGLVHGLRAGQTRSPIGGATIIQEGRPVVTNEKLLKRLQGTTLGKYISTEQGGTWYTWQDIQDALWRVEWETAGEKYFADYLQFSSAVDLVTWINTTFVSEEVYTALVRIQAYWIEDNSLPFFDKLKGANAVYSSFRKTSGTRSSESIVKASAWGTDISRRIRLEALLSAVWDRHYGWLPTFGSFDELRRLFWIQNCTSRDRQFRLAINGYQYGNLERRVASDLDHSIGASDGLRMVRVGLCTIWKVNFAGPVTFSEVTHPRWVTIKSDSNTYFYSYPVKFMNSRAVILRPCGQDTFWLNWIDPTLYEVQAVKENSPSSGSSARLFSYENSPEIWRNDPNFAPRREIELRRGHVTFSQMPRGRSNGVYLDTAKIRVKKKGSPYVGPFARQKVCDIHASIEGIWARGFRPPVFQVL